MRSYVSARAEPGEYITPNEINDELAELVGVIHSLDRDNFDEDDIASSKFALGAFGGIRLSTSEARIDVVHASGMEDQVYGIPFDSAAGVTIPWVLLVPTGDCQLELGLSVSFTDDVAELGWFLWVGIRVDGVLVARSPMQAEGTYRDSGYVTFKAPVGAGTHIIEPVYGLSRSVSGTVSFTDRLLSIREIAR